MLEGNHTAGCTSATMARQWDDKISTATVAIPSDSTISPPFSPPSATLTTVRRVNKDGTFVYIKYHFLANNGEKQLSADEALRFGGQHLDFSNHDFWQTTKRADPRELGFDPLDVTNVWPKKLFPLHELGKQNLNKTPENYHRDVEQAAFSSGSMVTGIEDSPGPLLKFRMFFYSDAQYHRIGVNLHQVQVNCPFMSGSYSSLNFDGLLRVDLNHAMNPNTH
ncbi:heme-dependent catalase [Aspergillus ruber CBS 135680]|uniref:Heme-dependent catalase n=1 Tax=Aspergillus ruber (strain CBS 135680) TaxID=1388766 RepID=A0A017SKJ6_ASPRC|nr:heme-dependent catalase [Aspergillus ruber CBS 135680]EYE96845.1 heme-dependent catalase [Aspergillus ruber CBS 135680]